MEFVPQILFLLCIFGWLVFMIFFKWSFFYEYPNTAPSLLISLINMFLEFGGSPSVNASLPVAANEYSVFGASEGAANIQRYIQLVFVLVAVLCIPWMLCIKPFWLLFKHKKSSGGLDDGITSYTVNSDSEEEDQIVHHDHLEKGVASNDEKGGESKAEKGHEEFEFGEAFVHQSIHTIEYCLGTISNTASYLRLWALSLAHAELSEVLWEMVLKMGVGLGVAMGPAIGVICMFGLFAFWAVLTIGILLVMEGLSAFLHALRLHWVEFQNKFYDGNGYKFKPFSFEAILKGEDEDY